MNGGHRLSIRLGESVLVYALERVGILEVYNGGYPYAFVCLVRMPQLLNLRLILFTRTRGLWIYEIRTHYRMSTIWFVVCLFACLPGSLSACLPASLIACLSLCI